MKPIIRFFVWLFAAVTITSCASLYKGSQVNNDHPLYVEDIAALSAGIYFLRPHTERSMGIADDALMVNIDDHEFLSLVKGEYTYAPLKPGQRTVTVISKTMKGADNAISTMVSRHTFAFSAGQVYFLLFTPIDGEFRGVTFRVENIDLAMAKDIVRTLRPSGMAKQLPITAL